MTLVFSIGHSNHDWSTFKRLLEMADIGAVADVRSSPASRLPHFNRAALKDRLNASGIAYVFLGLELGGRPNGGLVPDYELMAASPLFAEGIAQVEQIAPRTRLVLMCSEHEPLTCHRCLLVGRRLVERGVAVAHILRDGTVEPNEHTEDRLLALTRQTDSDRFAGKIVAEMPRTSAMGSSNENGLDGLGNPRQFRAELSGIKKLLQDTTLGVETYDFNFGDPDVQGKKLPGKAITSPPQWTPSAVSAHANACAVSQFLRDTLQRNNIDNSGGAMKSSINCVVALESDDRQQWFNAFWNGTQMVYGQRLNGNTLMSLSVDLDVVGHEMFHGVTERTARLEYVTQTGALNESISDIFGVIIANFTIPDTRNWNWRVGEGLSPDGKAFRDMSNPKAFDQPDHMRDFKVLPVTRKGDWGGVHTNSGIHNKAAFNILTAVDAAGNLVLNAQEVAAIFYLALTQQLSRTSQFSDSRRAVLTSARTLFRSLPVAQQTAKLDAIEHGFDAVGIT